MPNRMLIPEYDGLTYVGYLDISGFRQMVVENRPKAETVLNMFYATIFDRVYSANSDESTAIKLNAVVVSDCAVLFLSHHTNRISQNVDQVEGLSIMLDNVRTINRSFINKFQPFMTTCSIAYGDFHYKDKKEIEYVRKNCLLGSAYLDAFSDSESREPPMQPGECRILKNCLETAIPKSELFSLLKSKGKHYYFYWMVQSKSHIRSYESKYKETKDNMYSEFIKLIKASCEMGEKHP